MRIGRLYATWKAQAHMLVKHSVEWNEVYEVMEQGGEPRRLATMGGERRYYIKGRTEAGRKLKVIFAVEPPDTARVITAFEDR